MDNKALAPDNEAHAPYNRTLSPDNEALAPSNNALVPDNEALAPGNGALVSDDIRWDRLVRRLITLSTETKEEDRLRDSPWPESDRRET